MKKIIGLIIGTIVIISSCSNPRTKFFDIPIANDSTGLEAKVDSANGIKQDGLDYDPLNIGTYNQLPDTVTQWLNNKYAGWSLPSIPKDYLTKNKKTAPGPFYLKLDLNNDQILDYAVLYEYRDSATVAVYIVRENGQLQEFILERNPLESTSGESRSLQYLVLPKKKTNIPDSQTNLKNVLPEQTFGVAGKEKSTRLYFYNGKSFILANTQ